MLLVRRQNAAPLGCWLAGGDLVSALVCYTQFTVCYLFFLSFFPFSFSFQPSLSPEMHWTTNCVSQRNEAPLTVFHWPENEPRIVKCVTCVCVRHRLWIPLMTRQTTLAEGCFVPHLEDCCYNWPCIVQWAESAANTTKAMIWIPTVAQVTEEIMFPGEAKKDMHHFNVIILGLKCESEEPTSRVRCRFLWCN